MTKKTVSVFLLAVTGLVLMISSARSQSSYEWVGAYQSQPYMVNGTPVRYFAVSFEGEFTKSNMMAAADWALKNIKQKGSCAVDYQVAFTADSETHLIVGCAADNGVNSWTAVKIVGQNNSAYRILGKGENYTDGWVPVDVNINGTNVRYQFCDDDHGKIAFVFKHTHK